MENFRFADSYEKNETTSLLQGTESKLQTESDSDN